MSDMFTTDMTWLDIAEQDPAPVSSKRKSSYKPKGLWQASDAHRKKISALALKRNANDPDLPRNKRLQQAIQRYESGEVMLPPAKSPLNGRPLQTPFGRYESIQRAMLASGLSDLAIRHWVVHDPKRFYWLPLPENKPNPMRKKMAVCKPGEVYRPGPAAKAIHTPFGDFLSLRQAADAWDVANAHAKIQKELKRNPTHFYYIKEKK
jgi:hypothetical protein